MCPIRLGFGSCYEESAMALREINLVPGDILAHRQLMRHLYLWAGCLVISLSLIGGFYLYQTRVVFAKERAFTSLKQVHTHLGARIGKIKQLQEELDKLSQQQAVLDSIMKKQSYSKVLSRLADIMSPHTRLTQLAMERGREKERNIRATLTGFSLSNKALGNFLNQLTREPLFKTVALKYAKETTMEQPNQNMGKAVKLIQFQIDCAI
jgi:Tfp pilus assembly protein PilN